MPRPPRGRPAPTRSPMLSWEAGGDAVQQGPKGTSGVCVRTQNQQCLFRIGINVNT